MMPMYATIFVFEWKVGFCCLCYQSKFMHAKSVSVVRSVYTFWRKQVYGARDLLKVISKLQGSKLSRFCSTICTLHMVTEVFKHVALFQYILPHLFKNNNMIQNENTDSPISNEILAIGSSKSSPLQGNHFYSYSNNWSEIFLALQKAAIPILSPNENKKEMRINFKYLCIQQNA